MTTNSKIFKKSNLSIKKFIKGWYINTNFNDEKPRRCLVNMNTGNSFIHNGYTKNLQRTYHWTPTYKETSLYFYDKKCKTLIKKLDITFSLKINK